MAPSSVPDRPGKYALAPSSSGIVWPGPRKLSWAEAAPFGPGLDRPEPDAEAPGGDLILCFHGFPSTPLCYRLVEKAAKRRGFELAAPLMPGCGTVPCDILEFGYQDWIGFGTNLWRRLRPRWKRAWLVGTSVGGSVALEIAAAFAADAALAPNGIATIGSPVVLNALLRRGMMKSALLYFAGALSPLVPSMGAALPDPDRPGEDGDERWRGYLGTYTAFSHSLQKGLRSLERRLPAIRAPVLALHEVRDRMIDPRNARIIADEAGGGGKAIFLDMGDAGHMRHDLLLYDSTRDRAWSAIMDHFDAIREAGAGPRGRMD
ncbi:MAG: alpha/beta fold hydrolase [Spirochaetales bacterium]|nr:alpha/beta fold hydrolase [Spirochaetales bacterium]